MNKDRTEIDRLRAEVADIKSANQLLTGLIENRDAEIDRLRAENRMLTKALDRVAKSNGLPSWESLTDEDDKS